MKCLIFFALIFTFLSTDICAQSQKIQIAPVNPKLIEHLNSNKMGILKKSAIDGQSLGYIPHSIEYNNNTPSELKKGVILPDSFDLRKEKKLTSVKDQSSCGACWTFATYGSIESRWLTLGAGSYDFSEQNLKNGNGFERDHCSGGNASISTAYLTRGSGPILEKDDPYNVNDNEYVSGLTPAGYVTDARFLSNDAAILKEKLMNYGALYTTMYWEDIYYNSTNYSYYFNDSADSTTNHSVLLVGWNDTKQTDGGKGAWIIRNSWGSSFGDSGFFYVSYKDIKINMHVAYWPNKINYDSSCTIYKYDELGSIGTVGFGEPSAHGLLKFTMKKKQEISKIGSWIPNSNTTIRFDIYGNFDGSSLTTPLGSIGDQTTNFPGYYTFDLSSPILLNAGDNVYIKVKYSLQSGDSPIPVETVVAGYSNPVIERDKCWLSYNGKNNTWTKIGNDTKYKFDLCVNAYAVQDPNFIGSNKNIKKPNSFALNNYPNPFNPSTVINYQLPQAADVELTVFDIMGKKIRTLKKEYQQAGEYNITFDASGLANGVYFYKLICGKHVQVCKMVLMK